MLESAVLQVSVHCFVVETKLMMECDHDADCTDGDIRLVNGSNQLEGRLEICINNVWGTVCSQGFTADDAEVVCNQLKFPFNGLLDFL